jgi:ElaB/YqjD/DUF883 family membrane-anchored ribosome-binding protein
MTGSFDRMESGNDREYGGSIGNGGEDETELIAADIRITQERLGDTVEEIGERFNPTRLKEELKHDIRDATIGKVENMAQQTAEMVSDAQRTIMETIRENPVPFVIAGLGIGWMIVNATTKKRNQGSGMQSDGRDQYGDRSSYGDRQGRGYGSLYENQQGDVYDGFDEQDQSGTLDRVRSKASDVMDTVKDKTSQLADRTQRTVGNMEERAQDMAGRVADETRVQTRKLQDAYQDNPLVIGAAALALGLAAGLAIPATEKEAELVGETRDHLVDKVRDVAEETKDKVEQVAERVMDQAGSTAKDAAREVGLTS